MDYPEVERRELESIGDFDRGYLRPNRPIVLTRFNYWRDPEPMSLEWLKKHYGHLRLDELKRGTGAPVPVGPRHAQQWPTFGAYLDALSGGEYHPAEDIALPYLSNMDLPDNFPRIYRAIERPAALGRNYMVWSIDEPYRRFAQGELYVGPPDTGFSTLHFDMWRTSVVAFQMFGTKEWTVFPPSESRYLYLTAGDDGVAHVAPRELNPLAPDLKRFPEFAKAKGFRATVGEGDVLVLPPSWWHVTRHVTPSIAMNYRHLARHMIASSVFDQLLESTLVAMTRGYRRYVLRRGEADGRMLLH